MPFDFEEYQQKVNTLSTEQLHKEWDNYTRQISGGATSTAVSVLVSPLTAGVSLIGLGLSAPRIHNARKKRAIIEAGLQARGTTHNTRKRDVIAPMAISGTLGGLTLGLAGPGADMIAGEAAGHGVEYVVSHAALEGTAGVIEHTHTEHSKKKDQRKLEKQYQNFQQQYIQEQTRLYGQPPVGIQPGSGVLHPGTSQYPQQIPGQQPVYDPVPMSAQPSIAYPPTAPPQSFVSDQPSIAIQPAFQQEQLPQPGIAPFQIAPPASQPQPMFAPASHQQQFYQPIPAPQIPSQSVSLEQQIPQSSLESQSPYAPTPAPQYQQLQESEKPFVSVLGLSAQAGPIDSSYFPEKSAAYVASIPKLGQDGLAESSIPPCETPAPAYTETEGQAPVADMNKEAPPPSMTMDEEIELLKAKLLAMELQKRGVTLEIPATAAPEILQPEPLHIAKNSVTTTVEEVTVVTTSPVPSVPEPQPQSAFSPPIEGQQQSYPPPAHPQISNSPPIQNQQPQQNYAPPLQPQYSAQNTTTQIQQPTAVAYNAAPTAPQPGQPQLTVSPPVGGYQQQQSYPLPPPSPALPPRSPSMPTMQYAPPPPSQSQPQSQINTYPPPPPSPYQYQPAPSPSTYQPQNFASQAPSPSTYNPQTYAPPQTSYNSQQNYTSQPYQPPKSPNPQHQYQNQRHDSGYMSATGTPLPVLSSGVVSPQSTGASSNQYLHGRNPSMVSLNPSPMSPPPPYFPPPPGANVAGPGKDYFPQYQPQTQGYQAPATQSYQGTQGWQWGAPQQPNYGPPPPVPGAYGSPAYNGRPQAYEGT